MDEQIKAVFTGFQKTLVNNPAIRKFGLGVQATGKTITWVMGLTPTYFLMMVLCVIAGLINFYVVLTSDRPTSIQLIAGLDQTSQIAYCIFLVLCGAIIGYSKRLEILAIGSLVWAHYGIVVGFATLSGLYQPQRMLQTLCILIAVFAMAGRVVEQARREQAEKELRESAATFKAYKALKENQALG